MSSKKRRTKKTTEPAGDLVEPAKSGVSDGDTKSQPKRSLPAFGFAGDLLKKKDDPDLAERIAEDLATEDASGPESDDGGDADPHRIFSFADQLQSRQDREDQDKGPEARWETWVTFSLDEETFALPVEPVRQVVRVSNITRVPHAPRPIRGVTNLRGRVIPVIDLRMRVGLEPSEIGRQSRVVAVASRGRLLGLLVDAVHQVVHLDLNKVQPPPEDVMTIQSDYILGVYHQDDSLILLLDVDRALVLRDQAA